MTEKRSLSIRGHRTSISIEDAFWLGLKGLAERRGLTIPALVAEIDSVRGSGTNLSSALRLAVLADALERAAPTLATQKPTAPGSES